MSAKFEIGTTTESSVTGPGTGDSQLRCSPRLFSWHLREALWHPLTIQPHRNQA
jgi:hypothetical protein